MTNTNNPVYGAREREGSPMRYMLPFAALLLAACVTVRTPAGIARDLDGSLRIHTRETEPLLSLRCEAVYRAERQCEGIGAPRSCAWDGWVDADHDWWAVRACLARDEANGRQP